MIEFRQKFIEDATDLLQKLEQTILKLEQNKNDSALIEEVFRIMHTLKGTAGMFGFEDIGELTHRLENIYDLIRNGRLQVEKENLELTLKTVDFLNQVLAADQDQDFAEQYAFFYKKINAILNSIGENIFDGTQVEIDKIQQQNIRMTTWFIRIKPTSDLNQRGIRMHYIFDDINKSGKSSIFNRNQQQNNGTFMFWEILLSTETPKEEIEDILLFIDDISEIHHLADENLFAHDFFNQKVKELSELSEIDVAELLLFIQENMADEEERSPMPLVEAKFQENIRVAPERLDEQMDLLSELVTIKAEIQLLVQQNGYKDMIKAIEQLEKVSRRFRKNIFKIRLIPLANMELRLKRLIRDLSKQLNKKVEFVTEGMQTELDKTIIDSLESPLMHLIRNCLDHGIEAPDVRKMRGKHEKGTIKLKAHQAATNVFITVSDDGEGINSSKIQAKAVEKGIVGKKEKLTEAQIYDLIFAPGFSTAQNLSEVSGRGVGMDVVRQTISNLRGSITVESQKGKGSAFTIRLPLTLSIIDTMLVRSGMMFYSIPLSTIEKCTETRLHNLTKHDNAHVEIGNELLPYIVIKNELKTTDEIMPLEDKKHRVVIVKHENQKTALIVDEVIGEHQAVLKPLGEYFKQQDYISGATQLANGQIAVILDTPRLVAAKK